MEGKNEEEKNPSQFDKLLSEDCIKKYGLDSFRFPVPRTFHRPTTKRSTSQCIPKTWIYRPINYSIVVGSAR